MSSLSSAVLVLVLANIAQTSSFSVSRSNGVHSVSNRDVSMRSLPTSEEITFFAKRCSKVVASSFIAINLIGNFDMSSARADDAVASPATSTSIDDIPKVPLFTKKASDTQAYSDIGRGFRMIR